ncbi:MAG: cytidine deaminase [Ruminococcaceae bacterium]|nr:cytidine deaminase [Oscillospiraceae bacterium]
MHQLLLEKALKTLDNAYAPYSNFQVAAALECADGSIFTGVNIENASFGATLCAERSAFAAALSAGKRQFVRILIIGGTAGQISAFCPPCGICRQFMSEFCAPDFEIVLYNGEQFETHTLAALLPKGFLL